jgi:hypothetical protein
MITKVWEKYWSLFWTHLHRQTEIIKERVFIFKSRGSKRVNAPEFLMLYAHYSLRNLSNKLRGIITLNNVILMCWRMFVSITLCPIMVDRCALLLHIQKVLSSILSPDWTFFLQFLHAKMLSVFDSMKQIMQKNPMPIYEDQEHLQWYLSHKLLQTLSH